jgi:hypothetical protein
MVRNVPQIEEGEATPLYLRTPAWEIDCEKNVLIKTSAESKESLM